MHDDHMLPCILSLRYVNVCVCYGCYCLFYRLQSLGKKILTLSIKTKPLMLQLSMLSSSCYLVGGVCVCVCVPVCQLIDGFVIINIGFAGIFLTMIIIPVYYIVMKNYGKGLKDRCE